MADWSSILGSQPVGGVRPSNFPAGMDASMVLNPNDPTISDANVIEPVTKTPDFMTQVSMQDPNNVASMVKALMSRN